MVCSSIPIIGIPLIPIGMNDVLPKPFTKEGLLLMLEHQLSHLTRNKQPEPGTIAPHLGFTNSHQQHGMHPDQQQQPLNESSNPSNNSLKYSVSPAPSKSPGTTGLYGPGRSPNDLGAEDVTAQVQPPGGMGDPGGYVGMMGAYMPEDPNAQGPHGGYQSPITGGRRAADDDMYGSIKKQRY